MEIAFHCPNCSADLIYDESKKYTCCFCHTVLGPKDEVRELEGGYYVGDAWNGSLYHSYSCEGCGTAFIAKAAHNVECPICASASVKDQGEHIGAMPRRAIPFSQTKAKAEEVFLDYVRNNSVVGKIIGTEENASLLRKVYVPIWVFNYEVVANVRLNANIRNKANESTTIMGFNVPGQLMERLSPIRSSISRFQQNRKGGKDMADVPTEYTTGGVLSWQGIPFDASGILPPTVMTALQPYDQSKLTKINDRVVADTPVLDITKDPIAAMEEFMERIKKWTRQMIMDAHAVSYEIVHFSDKTDYPLGIGELVLFPIWYMKSEYDGREFFFAMNGQSGEVEAKIPMAKVSKKSNTISYDQYWDKERCTALKDTHFEFNIHDPNLEILDYSFFEKPKNSRVTADGSDIAPIGGDAHLDDVFNSELEAEKPKKVEKTGLEVENLRTDKKLTKEEEAKRAREVTARLRVAAKESPKGDMSAASEAPSWAKAVTPPPSASGASRPASRTKKPVAERPSKASVANKPIWERSPEDEETLNSKPMSLADRIAQAQNGEVPAKEREEEMQTKKTGIIAETESLMQEQEKVVKVRARNEVPDEDVREIPVESKDVDSDVYEIPMPKAERPSRVEPVTEETVPEEDDVLSEVKPGEEGEEMISNITFSFPKKKKSVYSGEPSMSGTSIPRPAERLPEQAQGMTLMNSEYESGVLHGGTISREELDDEVREITPKVNATENYIGSDKNDRPLAYRPAAPLAKQRGDVYVEEVELHPEQDENNRPLANRPPAPLARVTEAEPSVEYLAEKPLSDDIHQMPSIEKQRTKWGEMPSAASTPAWAKPQQSDNEDESPRRTAMASRMASPRERVRRPSREELMAQDRARNEANAARLGVELPETQTATRPAATRPAATRPGAVARNQSVTKEEETRTRPAYLAAVEQPKNIQEDSEEEEVRPISSAFRPANRPAASRVAREENEEETTSRPAATRPAATRPAARPAGRPGSSRMNASEPAAQKSVPIWERVPENDGSRPQWASTSVYEDERPRGSLSKPAGQVIDVEKPRTRPSVWRPDVDSAKEILSGGLDAQYKNEGGNVPLRSNGGEAREVPVRRSFAERQVQVERIESEDDVEEIVVKTKKPRRASSGIDVEMPDIPERQPNVVPVVEDEAPEVEQTPAAPVNERPRTFAQRRQMEEEERRRQIQSSFGTVAGTRPGTNSMRSRSQSDFDQKDDSTINRTYESTQFENKPSVVASLDQLPEALDDDSIHHLAKDSSVPALARGVDKLRDEVQESEKNAQRAIRDLPDFDPEGPNPFK